MNPGGGAGATLQIAGFPVRVRPTFLLLIGLVGWYPDITAARLGIWIVVATAAVLWHEMGHALAARRLGASPRIELYGFGGVTAWSPPTEPTRRQLIGVSFAGPFAGFLLGAATVSAVLVAGTTGSGDVRYFVLVVLWTNVGWGLVNLLPVLPLDGGHVLTELLPGDRPARRRRAALVSIVLAAVAGAFLVAGGVVFGALILAWIAMSNWTVLRHDRAERRREATEEELRAALGRLGHGDHSGIADLERLLGGMRPHSAGFRAAAIETAAATGGAPAARALLDASPPDEPLPPALYALVFAAESAGRDGVVDLIEMLRREPSSNHARWLAIALRWAGRLDDLPAVLTSIEGEVEPAVVRDAATAAEALGNPTVARDVRAMLA